MKTKQASTAAPPKLRPASDKEALGKALRENLARRKAKARAGKEPGK